MAGGTTTVILFAEKSRGESVAEKVARYHDVATDMGSYAGYGFHAIITDPTKSILEDELPMLATTSGITSIKLFLTYKHMRLSDDQFLRALHAARTLGMVALVHAENGDLVDFSPSTYRRSALPRLHTRLWRTLQPLKLRPSTGLSHSRLSWTRRC